MVVLVQVIELVVPVSIADRTTYVITRSTDPMRIAIIEPTSIAVKARLFGNNDFKFMRFVTSLN